MLSQRIKRHIFYGLITISSIIPQVLPDGGCLPFCYHKGRILFLLGQEAFGASKGNWTDFGGKSDPRENHLITASREFSEETRYVFGRGSMSRSMAFFQTHICLEVESRYGYHMFLVEVPYIDTKILKDGPKVPHYEKENYQWVDAENLLDVIEHTPSKNIAIFQGMTLRKCFVQTIRLNSDKIRKALVQYAQQKSTANRQASHSYTN